MLVIEGENFVRPGDLVSIWLDSDLQIRKLLFQTVLDGDRLDGMVVYRPLENGPLHPARIVVDIPAKKIRAILENYDYSRES